MHSGEECRVLVTPGESGQGITFSVSGMRIPARHEFVVDTMRCTTLGRDGALVHTVEHLMAAFWFSGITDCDVQLSAPEVPLMDGGCSAFCEAFDDAGTEVLDGEIEDVTIDVPLIAESHGHVVCAAPLNGFVASALVSFPDTVVGDQGFVYRGDRADFRSEISHARTMVREAEISSLRAAGLGLGGDRDSVLVVRETEYANSCRFPDEVARHKVLDLIGDLYLLGSVRGSFCSFMGGHALNHALRESILSRQVGGGRREGHRE